jgi:hypothetical protein
MKKEIQINSQNEAIYSRATKILEELDINIAVITASSLPPIIPGKNSQSVIAQQTVFYRLRLGRVPTTWISAGMHLARLQKGPCGFTKASKPYWMANPNLFTTNIHVIVRARTDGFP